MEPESLINTPMRVPQNCANFGICFSLHVSISGKLAPFSDLCLEQFLDPFLEPFMDPFLEPFLNPFLEPFLDPFLEPFLEAP